MDNSCLKIGDKVVLSEKSEFAGLGTNSSVKFGYVYGNPVGVTGEVITNEEYDRFTNEGEDPDYVYVKWANNMINCYPVNQKDLILIS